MVSSMCYKDNKNVKKLDRIVMKYLWNDTFQWREKLHKHYSLFSDFAHWRNFHLVEILNKEKLFLCLCLQIFKHHAWWQMNPGCDVVESLQLINQQTLHTTTFGETIYTILLWVHLECVLCNWSIFCARKIWVHFACFPRFYVFTSRDQVVGLILQNYFSFVKMS